MSEPSQRTHRTASILSIGDELVIGQSLDTNSKWLSSRLTDLGVRVVEHATVSDEPDLLRAAFERLVSGVDLVLATGGLGPTADDLTRDVLCDCMDDELVRDDRQHERLVELFRRRGRPLENGNDRQALRPASAVCMDNDQGTAPGSRRRSTMSMCTCSPVPRTRTGRCSSGSSCRVCGPTRSGRSRRA
ncbi:MAG: competence/damage-inducible protein A [Phycisphaerales bacterium]